MNKIKLKESDFIELLKKVIKEQDKPGPPSPPSPPPPPERTISSWEQWVDNYPNQCTYPNKVVQHPIIDGKSSEDSLIENFCFYPFSSTKNKGETAGKWVPSESEVIFWDFSNIDFVINKTINKKETNRFWSGFTNEDIINIVSQNLVIDTVKSFSFKGRKVNGWFTKPGNSFNSNKVTLKGYYYTDTKTPYVAPEWVDNRNLWDKLVDDYALYVQIGTAIAFVVFSIATGGLGGYALLAVELAIEGTLGAIIAQREKEKENPFWFMEIVLGLAPLLKGTKLLRGLSKAQADEMIKKMSKAGLNSRSTPEDVIKFYRSLPTDVEKMVFTRLLKDTSDELSEAALKKLISKQLTEEVYGYVSKNPELLKDLGFLNKVWAKELGVTGFIMAINLGLDVFFGKRLTEIQKRELEGIMLKMPEEVRKDFTAQILGNQENVEKLIENLSELSDKIEDNEKLNSTIENDKAYNIVDSLMNGFDINLDNPYAENVSNIPDGYVELSDDELYEFADDIEESKEFNGITYYLLKKNLTRIKN